MVNLRVKMAKETVVELKKELKRLMVTLLNDDDDCSVEVTENAIQTLSALKELKLNPPDLVNINEPPPQFRCPISGNLMKEPVVAASGQTYDEASIRKWLEDGNDRSPQSGQPLPHTVLIPNHSIKKLIADWCQKNSFDMPASFTSDEEYGANANEDHLRELLERLSSSLVSDQTTAMKELRLLTAKFPSFRALFGEIQGVIPRLFVSHSNTDLHDDLVATILNISTHESNKREILTGSNLPLQLLTVSLSADSIERRRHAAAALSTLSTLDSNKPIIGESGVTKPLIRLIQEGDPLVIKDAALAILNLCKLIENSERALSDGAVLAVMDKIKDRILLDEMLEILARLSNHQRAIEEMEEQGMLFRLFDLLREDISEENKEHCVAIVYAMCFSDRMRLKKVYEVEDAYETLSGVAKTGTARAKRKANGLLQRLNRFAFISHTT